MDLSYLIDPLRLVYLFIFEAIYSGIGNYGVSLLILSVVTSLLIIPLEKEVSGAVQRQKLIESILEPQLASIRAGYMGAQRAKKIRNLFARYRYNPLLGIRTALPVLMQLPLLLGAYWLLEGYTPLAHVAFGPISDLSKPDGLLGGVNLLPIVMTLVNFASVAIATNLSSKERAQAVVIGILFLVLLYGAASALLIYWTMNNVWHFVRAIFTRLHHGKSVQLTKSQWMFRALVVATTVFFFGASALVSLYLHNPQDYQGSLSVFVEQYAPGLCVLFVVLFFAIVLLSQLDRKFDGSLAERLGVLLVFAVAAALIQDAVLTPKITVLDGREIVKKWHTIGILSLLMWLSATIGTQIYFNTVRRFVGAIAAVALLAMAGDFAVKYHQSFDSAILATGHASPQYRVDKEKAFTFSRDRNVVVILTDTFSGTVAKEIFKEEKYRKAYEGFTLLTDYTAAFPTTMVSVAALLSGQVYDNSIPVKDFYLKTKPETLMAKLKAMGYESTLGKNGVLFGYYDVDLFDNLMLDKTHRELSSDEQGATNKALRFKYFPVQLKTVDWSRFFPEPQKVASKSKKKPAKRSGWDFDFINDTEDLFTTGAGKPHFFYAHLSGAHHPYWVNAEYERGNTTEIEASRASLRSMAELVDRMRKTGVFENSIILISADHPDTPYKEKSIVGLLHLPGQSGKMMEDATPLDIQTAQKIVLDAVKADKTQLRNPQEFLRRYAQSGRYFYNYRWDDGWSKAFLPRITEYRIAGAGYLKENYHETGRMLFPGVHPIKKDGHWEFPRNYPEFQNSFADTYRVTSEGMYAGDKWSHRNQVQIVVEPPDRVRFKVSANWIDKNGNKKTWKRDFYKSSLAEFQLPQGAVLKSLTVSSELLDMANLRFHDLSNLIGNSSSYGWYGTEGTHTWSSSSSPSVKIELPEGRYTLEMPIFPFINLKQKSQNVTVLVNGEECASVTLTAEKLITCHALSDGKKLVEIGFILGGPVLRPVDVGVNHDGRPLGFGIRYLGVRRNSDGEN